MGRLTLNYLREPYVPSPVLIRESRGRSHNREEGDVKMG